MKVFTAPQPVKLNANEISVFLAGSIEMGKAEMWQDRVIESLKDVDNLVILNPRRPDWDNSWECTADNPQFREQVEWEQENLLIRSHVNFFYFAPDTISPISLLELGECLAMRVKPLIVVCSNRYSRIGNVQLTCGKWGQGVYSVLDDGIKELRRVICHN